MNNDAEKGYQLIEPNSLAGLTALGVKYEIAMLCWVTFKLNDYLSEKKYPTKAEVVIAQYEVPYPCIGLHYFDNSNLDLGPEIEKKIGYIVSGSIISEFLSFTNANQDLINEIFKKLDMN